MYNACVKVEGFLVKKLGIVIVAGLSLGSLASAQMERDAAPLSSGVAPILAAFPAQSVRPGRDRFNDNPANTLEGLVETLKTNKTFRVNLARHFAVPEERIVEFVQDALVPQYLAANTKVPNYGVTKSGTIYNKVTTLKKGTRVWATRAGKPVLKWDCSNPITKDTVVLKRKPNPTPSSISREVKVLSPEATLLTPGELDAPIGITLASDMPFDPIVSPPTEIKVTPPTNPRPPTAITSIARSGIPLLPVAGVIGLAVRSSSTPSSVPEPATIALLGLGALSLFARRRS
jgi:PEP-CTERM motif